MTNRLAALLIASLLAAAQSPAQIALNEKEYFERIFPRQTRGVLAVTT